MDLRGKWNSTLGGSKLRPALAVVLLLGVALTIGIMGPDSRSNLLVAFLTVVSTLFSIAYLLWWAVRDASWAGLRTSVIAGWGLSFGLAMLLASMPFIDAQGDIQAQLFALPAGEFLWALQGTIAMLSLILTPVLVIRWLHRKVTGGQSGGGGGTSPEEQVLSEEEQEEFDHPHKELVRIFSALS